MNLGNVYQQTGRFDEAEEAYGDAIGIYSSISGTDFQQTMCRMNLGGVYSLTGQFEKAEKAYMEAIEVYRSLPEAEFIMPYVQ